LTLTFTPLFIKVDDTGMIPRGSSIFTSPRGWFSETEVQGRGWAVMALPSKLVIDKEWGLTDVKVSVERKDDQWKGGMVRKLEWKSFENESFNV
jgi:hypothetical protein